MDTNALSPAPAAGAEIISLPTSSVRPLVNEVEAARLLGLSVKTLRRWRWAGRGPRFRKLGRAVRYDLADLAQFAAEGARQSTSDPGPRVAA